MKSYILFRVSAPNYRTVEDPKIIESVFEFATSLVAGWGILILILFGIGIVTMVVVRVLFPHLAGGFVQGLITIIGHVLDYIGLGWNKALRPEVNVLIHGVEGVVNGVESLFSHHHHIPNISIPKIPIGTINRFIADLKRTLKLSKAFEREVHGIPTMITYTLSARLHDTAACSSNKVEHTLASPLRWFAELWHTSDVCSDEFQWSYVGTFWGMSTGWIFELVAVIMFFYLIFRTHLGKCVWDTFVNAIVFCLSVVMFSVYAPYRVFVDFTWANDVPIAAH